MIGLRDTLENARRFNNAVVQLESELKAEGKPTTFVHHLYELSTAEKARMAEIIDAVNDGRTTVR